MSSPSIPIPAGSARAWLLAIRPRTLPASAAPVVLGWALAASVGGATVGLGFVCLFVALSLQIAANLANDLFDAMTGVDGEERLGPMRVTQTGLLAPRQVMTGIVVSVLLASGLGLYAVWHAGWWLLALGALCVAGAMAYTAGPFPLARLGLGELAALVFFGPVATTGTFAVLHGAPTAPALLAGLVPGLHAAAIMAVNNLRDIETDTSANKLTLAVRVGERRARLVAAALVIAGNCCVIPLALLLERPALLLALLLVPMSAPLVRSMLQTPRSAKLNAVLARTGRWGLLTCLTISALTLV